MTVWTNEDGLKVPFNLASAKQQESGATAVAATRQMIIYYNSQDVGDLETAGNTSGREAFIPGNAYITRASFLVDTAFTSGGSTTLTIGLAEADGTAIDADGIDATIAKTALDAVGDVVACDGALVAGVLQAGGASGASKEAYVYFTTASGPWTAGSGRLVIEYVVA